MASIRKVRVDQAVRWTSFDDQGKRIDTFTSEEDAYVSIGLCPVRKYHSSRDFTGSTCREVIKTEGARKCNRHLAVDRRRVQKDQEQRDEWAARRTREDQLRATRSDRLAHIRELGIEARDWDLATNVVYTGRGGGYEVRSGWVIADGLLQELLKLASK